MQNVLILCWQQQGSCPRYQLRTEPLNSRQRLTVSNLISSLNLHIHQFGYTYNESCLWAVSGSPTTITALFIQRTLIIMAPYVSHQCFVAYLLLHCSLACCHTYSISKGLPVHQHPPVALSLTPYSHTLLCEINVSTKGATRLEPRCN